jgi:hypothetical protein
VSVLPARPAEGPNFDSSQSKEFFYSKSSKQSVQLAQAPIKLVNRGGGTIFPGIKQPERETWLSPSSSVQFKNEWNYASTTLLHAFMGWTGRTSSHLRFTV